MRTQLITPLPALAHYVSHIMVLESEHLPFGTTLPLIAKGCPSVVFQLTASHLPVDHLVLYGQNIRPILLPVSGPTMLIAYFLYPHTLKALFGWSAKELTDLSVDISLSEPARGMRLKEQLLNAPSPAQRLTLMNDYFLQLVSPRKPDLSQPVLFATQMIQQHSGALPMLKVQQELYVTERTLQRMFEMHVGVSPKTYGRICQFDAALRQLSANGFTDMAGVAFQHGYADQSHLIRAFRDFTGLTPLEYLKAATDFPS
ncbi:helix-turn-helix domain-containing protein [Chitinophaga varians]|uniref:helix-turn-helix domain-containing protein n=1 Tax=Chitinophaga varians TaxID=2202339 RepID=UPI00165FF3C1|nr:helix-turn-helix domain-containing protein [Chitinophaga varians]MBC9913480.1 AraC family transcriptional regulator [Chitinophaga varians]